MELLAKNQNYGKNRNFFSKFDEISVFHLLVHLVYLYQLNN